MIFPFLRGLVSPALAPITYLLFALNVFVFLGTFELTDAGDQKLDAYLNDREYMETQGLAFASMIQRMAGDFSPTQVVLSEKALAGESDSRRILGSLAMRNNTFMELASDYDFQGDEVAVAKWREKYRELLELQAEHPSYLWGLSRMHDGALQYITYQFAHSGLMHLVWNMVFLLIFGIFVEVKLGSSHVAITSIGAGIFGALVFSKLSGISSSPLVGASAAVSGLMALVGVYWLGREKLRFFFWLLPADGYFGVMTLPSWLILLVSLLPDLSGYLGASREFGSVAYSAHIGGAAFGALIALGLRAGFLVSEVEEPAADEKKPADPIGRAG